MSNGMFRYHAFARQVSRVSRYFWPDEVKAFLSDVEESMSKRVFNLEADENFVWRARIGCNWEPVCDQEGNLVDEDPAPYEEKEIMPLWDKATEGRANPKGIPVLYTASDRITAVSEIRPWIGAQVSIAYMKVVQDLMLVNCFQNHGERNTKFYFKENLTKDEQIEAIWTDIDNAFARPTTRDDTTADYVPTQILTELFRSKGFDGIAFKSSVADGLNLILFDKNTVEIVHRQVVEITKAEFGCKWSGGVRFPSLGDR